MREDSQQAANRAAALLAQYGVKFDLMNLDAADPKNAPAFRYADLSSSKGRA